MNLGGSATEARCSDHQDFLATTLTSPGDAFSLNEFGPVDGFSTLLKCGQGLIDLRQIAVNELGPNTM